MRDWPVSVVPNAIDTELYQPIDKALARKLLRINGEGPLVLFGAGGSNRDSRKGFDLLQLALDDLRGEIPGLQLVVLGECAPREPVDLGFPVHYAGQLHDDISLSLFYSAADVVVVPSRQETFSLVSAEAHACGTPVVAFDATALPGIIEHGKTGYLAKPFDAADLARGIQWVLEDTDRRKALGARSRQVAVERFSFPVVAEQYLGVYNAAVCAHEKDDGFPM
jgi:glycosyltransferase involved in cell wall biosynthesis